MRSEEREIGRKRRRWEKNREENMIYHNLFEWLAHFGLGMLQDFFNVPGSALTLVLRSEGE